MRTTRLTPAALAVAATALSLAAPPAALGQSEPRQRYSDVFTTREPNAATGRTLAVDWFRPGDPEAKPPAWSRVVLELHPGARFDTSAVPQCRASDAELIALGPAVCPPGSVVGEDETVTDTGFPGPDRFVTADSTVFNNQDELVFLAQVRGSGSRLVVRGRVSGNTLTIDLPPLPGTPPDGGAFRRERATFFAASSVRDGRRVAWLTTPPTCPPSGQWTNRVTYTYRDGVTQTAESQSPCVRGAGGGEDRSGPRIRVGGVPTRGCVSRSFAARVRTSDGSGVQRVQLRLDGRRIADAAGGRLRAPVAASRLRPGRHRVTAVAVDQAGNRATATARFRRCARGAAPFVG